MKGKREYSGTVHIPRFAHADCDDAVVNFAFIITSHKKKGS
jgi:hypothetical protein